MELLRGRLFSEFDNEKTASVAVINETMARTYWPNEDPLGKQLKVSRTATVWTTVVGIVADARTESLENARVPEVFLSLYQKGEHHLAVFLRGHLDAGAIPEQVREQVQAVDATLPVYGAQTLSETVSLSLSERRFSMEMVGLFAVTALLLAGLGIYGVISYLVSERTHEIGIRVALGAQRKNIMRMVLRQGLGLAITGTAIGLVCALIVSNLMAGLLYGVRPTDPATYAGVAALLIVVALFACYIPGRRAIRVDPIVALRHE
jgi:putative ABC transport system permease protein